jgi:hypothetical protein
LGLAGLPGLFHLPARDYCGADCTEEAHGTHCRCDGRHLFGPVGVRGLHPLHSVMSPSQRCDVEARGAHAPTQRMLRPGGTLGPRAGVERPLGVVNARAAPKGGNVTPRRYPIVGLTGRPTGLGCRPGAHCLDTQARIPGPAVAAAETRFRSSTHRSSTAGPRRERSSDSPGPGTGPNTRVRASVLPGGDGRRQAPRFFLRHQPMSI